MRYFRFPFLGLLVMLMGSGCSTITEGDDQGTLIDSDPRGASCDLWRGGIIAHVSSTPQSVHLEKSSQDILVRCKKGDLAGEATLTSEESSAMWGNILMGGLVGVAVDAASGAAWSYPESIIVPLRQTAE